MVLLQIKYFWSKYIYMYKNMKRAADVILNKDEIKEMHIYVNSFSDIEVNCIYRYVDWDRNKYSQLKVSILTEKVYFKHDHMPSFEERLRNGKGEPNFPLDNFVVRSILSYIIERDLLQ